MIIVLFAKHDKYLIKFRRWRFLQEIIIGRDSLIGLEVAIRQLNFFWPSPQICSSQNALDPLSLYRRQTYRQKTEFTKVQSYKSYLFINAIIIATFSFEYRITFRSMETL